MMNNKFIQLRGVCMYLGAIIQRLARRSARNEEENKRVVRRRDAHGGPIRGSQTHARLRLSQA